MTNMSYCRFENTVMDMRDCVENLTDDLSEREAAERVAFIELCMQVAEEYESVDDLATYFEQSSAAVVDAGFDRAKAFINNYIEKNAQPFSDWSGLQSIYNEMTDAVQEKVNERIEDYLEWLDEEGIAARRVS